jgi:hypothetical protein
MSILIVGRDCKDRWLIKFCILSASFCTALHSTAFYKPPNAARCTVATSNTHLTAVADDETAIKLLL